MKLEAGKRYERRDGGRSGPLTETQTDHPAYRVTDGLMSWHSDGRYLISGKSSPFDLVKEVEDPQPLEWKRGIPTEEECRECWIVDGGDDAVPESCGGTDAPGECTPDDIGMRNTTWYLALRIKPIEPPPKPKTVTQRQYISEAREELWTDKPSHIVHSSWKPTGLTREVPA